MHRRLLAAIFAAGLIATGCGGSPDVTSSTGESAPETSTQPSQEGSGRVKNGASAAPRDPAPDFTFTTFEGDRFALGEQRGTPVVLNFWESW